MRVLAWVMVLAGCGDNIPFGTCEIGAVPADATIQAISEDGSLVAYRSGDSLWVTPAQCGAEAPTNVGTALSLARFCGHTLVAFRNAVSDDYAAQLLVWNASQAAPVFVARDVDPGATHCSDDGRYFSTEANDRLDDGIDTVTVTLVSTETLMPRALAELDKAHARFTHDSRFLVYSGTDGIGTALWRLPVDGGPAVQLTTAEHGGRWEITSDDTWVVFHRDGNLRKVGLLDGGDVLLDAGGVYSVKGRELDVADDGMVVYVRTTVAPALQLAAIPVAGGTRTVLDESSTGSLRLVEHDPGIVFYTLGLLQMVSTSGKHQPATGGYIADHLQDKTLLIDGHEVLRVDDRSMGVETLAKDIAQVALDREGREIGLTANGSLEELGDTSSIFDGEIGNFFLSGDRSTIAAITNEPGSGSTIMRAILP